MKRMNALARKLGKSSKCRAVFIHIGMNTHMTGIYVPSEVPDPDPKVWKAAKQYRQFVPKATRAAGDVKYQIEELKHEGFDKLRKMVGLTEVFEMHNDDGQGPYMFKGAFGLAQGKDDHIYLTVAEQEKREPKMATRVSDLVYERYCGK